MSSRIFANVGGRMLMCGFCVGKQVETVKIKRI